MWQYSYFHLRSFTNTLLKEMLLRQGSSSSLPKKQKQKEQSSKVVWYIWKMIFLPLLLELRTDQLLRPGSTNIWLKMLRVLWVFAFLEVMQPVVLSITLSLVLPILQVSMFLTGMLMAVLCFCLRMVFILKQSSLPRPLMR